jgi:hypothetical protein
VKNSIEDYCRSCRIEMEKFKNHFYDDLEEYLCTTFLKLHQMQDVVTKWFESKCRKCEEKK